MNYGDSVRRNRRAVTFSAFEIQIGREFEVLIRWDDNNLKAITEIRIFLFNNRNLLWVDSVVNQGMKIVR